MYIIMCKLCTFTYHVLYVTVNKFKKKKPKTQKNIPQTFSHSTYLTFFYCA